MPPKVSSADRVMRAAARRRRSALLFARMTSIGSPGAVDDPADDGPLFLAELIGGSEHGSQNGASVDRRGRSGLDPGQGGVAGGEQAQRGVELERSVGADGGVECAQVAGVHRQRSRRRRGPGHRGRGRSAGCRGRRRT